MLQSSVTAKTVKLSEELRNAEKRAQRLQAELDQFMEFKRKLEVFLKVQSLPLPELLTTVQLALTRRDHSLKQELSEQHVVLLERKIIELTNEVNFLQNQPKSSPQSDAQQAAVKAAHQAASTAQLVARSREQKLAQVEKEYRECRIKADELSEQNRLLRARVKYLESSLQQKQNAKTTAPVTETAGEQKQQAVKEAPAGTAATAAVVQPSAQPSAQKPEETRKSEAGKEDANGLEMNQTVERLPAQEPAAKEEQQPALEEIAHQDSVVPLGEL